MQSLHYIGAALVLAIITLIGYLSGRKVKSAEDFSVGGRSAGAGVVVGSIIGTLVGGASTIGTAELAFSYGFSAWWFTLGGGVGVLVMAIVYAKPLYESGIHTLPQIFAREYGGVCSTAATLLTSMGSFLSIVSQVFSGIALITAVSSLSVGAATLLTVALMMIYVVFGGVWGAGYVGMVKTVLLCAALTGCGILTLAMLGGLPAFTQSLPRDMYFNLLARGAAADLGAGLSLVLGVLTTQSYIQSVISARSLRESRKGLFISALIMPVVGIGGIFVGMFMRLTAPSIKPSTALPVFIMEQLPPVLGGAVLATLLVALVGTGAGVALGLSSMLYSDIYKKYLNKTVDETRGLFVSRVIIICILAVAALFSLGNMGTLILSWSFLSMGLRGAVAFLPMCAALFCKGRLHKSYALASMISGPLLVVAGKLLLPFSIDPLFYGVAGAAVIILVGLARGKKPDRVGQ
jgi:SSS family solute:Na+ symporter